MSDAEGAHLAVPKEDAVRTHRPIIVEGGNEGNCCSTCPFAPEKRKKVMDMNYVRLKISQHFQRRNPMACCCGSDRLNNRKCTRCHLVVVQSNDPNIYTRA